MIYYRHNKTGNRYRLLACGIDSTNERDGLPVVVYCPDDDEHSIYVRELREFEAKFTAIGIDGNGGSGDAS